jgi:HEAT repeat protein
MLMRSNKKQGLGIGSWGFAVALLVAAMWVVSGFSLTVTAQQYTFNEVASGLKHQDAGTRLRAIQILKDADYAEAAAPIAIALGDVDDRVQLAAIDAERSLFTTRAVSRRKRIGFVVEVRTVSCGDAAALGQLALKARAVPPQVLTSRAVALRDSTPRVRAEAINLASLLGPYACTRTSDSCTAIGNALVDNINSREALVRRAAMQALGQLRYPNAVQALSDQLSYRQRGPDAMAALEGLAGIGHPTSVSVFEELLTNPNADMRRLAVEGLAHIGNRGALPTLQQLGQSERSDGVLLALHYANVKLEGVDGSLQQLIASLRTPSQRPLVLRYLLDLSGSVAPSLAESLKDQSADVRRLVADVLGFSRNAAVLPALEAATKDSDPDVAAAAQQAIERLKL